MHLNAQISSFLCLFNKNSFLLINNWWLLLFFSRTDRMSALIFHHRGFNAPSWRRMKLSLFFLTNRQVGSFMSPLIFFGFIPPLKMHKLKINQHARSHPVVPLNYRAGDTQAQPERNHCCIEDIPIYQTLSGARQEASPRRLWFNAFCNSESLLIQVLKQNKINKNRKNYKKPGPWWF